MLSCRLYVIGVGTNRARGRMRTKTALGPSTGSAFNAEGTGGRHRRFRGGSGGSAMCPHLAQRSPQLCVGQSTCSHMPTTCLVAASALAQCWLHGVHAFPRLTEQQSGLHGCTSSYLPVRQIDHRTCPSIASIQRGSVVRLNNELGCMVAHQLTCQWGRCSKQTAERFHASAQARIQ